MLLEKSLIEEIIAKSLATGADFAEVYTEDRISSGIMLIGGHVEKANSAKTFGVGLRLAQGLFSVYGYTNSKNPDDLLKLASDLSKSFSADKKTVPVKLGKIEVGTHHKVKINPRDVKQETKVALMQRAYKAAKEYDEVIQQVSVNLSDWVQNVEIANSLGRYVTEERVRIRFYVSAIAGKDGMMQTGGEGPGTAQGYEYFDTECNVEETAIKAAKTAKTMLFADECPSGVMAVILNNEFGGVIFHEACGHSLEATSVSKNASVFCGKLGTVVASPIVNAIDDGTIENGWGSANFDDEGYPQQRRVLIENGVLKTYMVDLLNTRRMDHKPTGSSRRESYKFAPTSRMSNTFIDNGTSTFEEIIKATEYGLFAAKMGGGSVNPGNGDFNFSVSEGYMVRNGKIAEPVRGASLVGNGADILFKIDMIANNLERARGMCGSASGSIPADVGQPTLRVHSITVGGKKGAK
ncbi:MAG: TldD/PmbA family protein [Candidatus Izemoplasmatales bacterium]|jgi:TldD protein|nr:TldD/PmbA family protein [Candidatus Izemoplasmatales bacterium]MDD3865725.1 TldD/PmbA family protein [Candidatus Izemoplasmatales bacterium]